MRMQSANAEHNPGNRTLPLQGAEKLLRIAKRNFYYRDDASKASYLCSQVISRFPFSEPADEARLLLHDIAIENREKASRFASEYRYQKSGERAVPRSEPGTLKPTTTKISVAVAIVALPIIGLAGGGIVGIGLPELIGLLLMESLFLGASKIRNLMSGRDPEKEQCRARA